MPGWCCPRPASIMKALVEGFMSQQPVAYLLFAAGAVIAVVMEMLGVPALIFALGMYLPLELNTPALVGGILSHCLTRKIGENRRGTRAQAAGARRDIASGFMAGGALGGVIGAACRLFPGTRKISSGRPFTPTRPFRSRSRSCCSPVCARTCGSRRRGKKTIAGPCLQTKELEHFKCSFKMRPSLINHHCASLVS